MGFPIAINIELLTESNHDSLLATLLKLCQNRRGRCRHLRRKLAKAALLGEFFNNSTTRFWPAAAALLCRPTVAVNDRAPQRMSAAASQRSALHGHSSARESGPALREWGDGADVAFEVFCEQSWQPTQSLAGGKPKSCGASECERCGKMPRRRFLTEAFARATPLEAKYHGSSALGDLRIGLREGLVEDADLACVQATTG